MTDSTGFGAALVAIHHACRTARVSYAVIGGIGVSLWARPRATLDVDVLVSASLARVPALRGALVKQGVRIVQAEESPDLLMAGLRGLLGSIAIDVLVSSNPLVGEILSRRRRKRVGGTTVWVLGAEDLIVLKLQSGRALDLEDARAILVARAGRLDLSLLDTLAETFDVAAIWRRMRPES